LDGHQGRRAVADIFPELHLGRDVGRLAGQDADPSAARKAVVHLPRDACLAGRRDAEIRAAVERREAMSGEEAHHASVQMAAHRQDVGYLRAELGRPGAAHQALLELRRRAVPHREPPEKPDVVPAAAAVLPVK